VQLTANYATQTVKVKQTGPNNSGVNGSLIGMGLEEVAKNGDKVNVVLGEIDFEVVFDVNENKIEENDVEMMEDDEVKEKPAKIPKMFLKGSPSKESRNQFKKDELLLKGSWEYKYDKQLVVYVMGPSVTEPKPNVSSRHL